MLRRYIFTFVIMLLFVGNAIAQCPVNMGFDKGDFTNWVGSTGTITTAGLQLTDQNIVTNVHTLITRVQQLKDQYAGFSLTSPNGSSTIAMLGNSTVGRGLDKAQRLSYTFTVPKNNNNFSLIYYYAVVLEDPPNDPNHNVSTKPKFAAAVYNVTDGKYTDCANFDFVAISNLPGFTKAPVQSPSGTVYYKSWSPVTIDLRGYAGKTLRLDFTTNNCVPGGHFAYAYIDINQNCGSPLSGNIICVNNTTLTLKAPEGFEAYHWFNGTDFSSEIGSQSTYSVTPIPPVGTKYSVIIVPYEGLGCVDTLTTTIMPAENLALNVASNIQTCEYSTTDITVPAVTAGSDPSFDFTYYTDAACTEFIIDPTRLTAGDYYIKATPPSGCYFIKKITVTDLPSPGLKITNPPEVCVPATVDITKASVTAGSIAPVNLTYWKDAAATVPLLNPDKIAVTNTYYIKSIITSDNCMDIKPVTVLINNLPVLKTFAVQGCETADITVPAATQSNTEVSYTYWLDKAATMSLTAPKAITATGTYYIKATTPPGCSVTEPIDVKIFPYPVLTITNPATVVFPQPVDITQTFAREANTSYYYYKDEKCTKPVPDPAKVTRQGTYYIKAVNGNNCSLISPVIVTVLAPPAVDFDVNTFTPNGDGKNDTFAIKIPLSVKLKYFRIYGSWGGLLFETTNANQAWDGKSDGQPMPVGTYYWIFEGHDDYTTKDIRESGSITIVR